VRRGREPGRIAMHSGGVRAAAEPVGEGCLPGLARGRERGSSLVVKSV